MSKKGVKVEDLIEVVQDEKILDILEQRMLLKLSTTIEGLFDKLIERAAAKLETLVENAAKDLITKHCEFQSSQILEIKEENALTQVRLDDLEVNLRLDNLVVRGLAEGLEEVVPVGSTKSAQSLYSASQATVKKVKDLCVNEMGLKIEDTDISFAYRIPRFGKDVNRPVIVGFTSRRLRNLVYASRRVLQNRTADSATGVFINEHLTRTNAKIYAKARELMRAKKLTSTWTAGGQVFIRHSPGEKPQKITSMKPLEEL